MAAGQTTPTSAAPSGPTGDVYGEAGGLSCAEPYSPKALARRGFAFDGTVTDIGRAIAVGDAMPYVPVTFRVNRWFRGGQDAKVTVTMLPPVDDSSTGNPPYAKGSRLLVSGERSGDHPGDLHAWACGFTRWYEPTEVRRWEAAFR